MTRRSGDRARDLTIAALKGDSKLVAGGWRKVLALMYGLELCTRGPEEASETVSSFATFPKVCGELADRKIGGGSARGSLYSSEGSAEFA